MKLTNYRFYGSYHGSTTINTNHGEMTISQLFELYCIDYDLYKNMKIESWERKLDFDQYGEEVYGPAEATMVSIESIRRAETPKVSYYTKNGVECEESVMSTYYKCSGHKFIHLVGRGDIQPGITVNNSPTKGDWYRIVTSNSQVILNGENMFDNREIDIDATLA